MMGPSAFTAWRSGAFELREYPKEYEDDLFGTMVGANSLKGMIGETEAEKYYGTQEH